MKKRKTTSVKYHQNKAESSIAKEPEVPYSSSNNPYTFENVWKSIMELKNAIELMQKKDEERRREEEKRRAEEEKRRKEEKERRRQEEEKLRAEEEKRRKEEEEWRKREYEKTQKYFQETDRRIARAEKLFTSEWGKLIEALVEGELIPLLNQRGIPVITTSQRMHGKKIIDGKEVEWEFDIIAKNEQEVVIVEVKTDLGIRDVNRFIEKLEIAEKLSGEFAGKKIYGAVAFIRKSSDADKYAYRKGLFVIRAVGENAKILNDEKFQPRNFGT